MISTLKKNKRGFYKHKLCSLLVIKAIWYMAIKLFEHACARRFIREIEPFANIRKTHTLSISAMTVQPALHLSAWRARYYFLCYDLHSDATVAAFIMQMNKLNIP